MEPAWTIKEVAKLLNVNEKTVYRLSQAGELPGFKVAGHWRFLEEDIRAWIETKKNEAKRDSRERAPSV